MDNNMDMENYFRTQLKNYCYNEVKRLFYNKYECYGFLQKKYGEKETVFYYTYDLEEYKTICPKCSVY